ncbi:MAG: hypothetical protein V4630_06495 [Pseudomonadota bacterium]
MQEHLGLPDPAHRLNAIVTGHNPVAGRDEFHWNFTALRRDHGTGREAGRAALGLGGIRAGQSHFLHIRNGVIVLG